MSEARTFDITGYVRVYEFTPGKFSLGICIYDTYAQAVDGDDVAAVEPIRVQGKAGDGLRTRSVRWRRENTCKR